MSEKIQKLLEEIQQLTLLEASELVKGLEERFGVSAAAAAPVAAAGPAGPAAEEVEEQTEFNLILTGFGANKKINTIKVVSRSDQPGSQGGQGSGGQCPQAR